MEIEHDVYEEDDVDDGVNHQQGDVLGGLVLEGNVVRHHDGGVEGEAQDDPVPDGLEGAVMEEDVWRGFGGFLPVLGHDVRIEAHHLSIRSATHTRTVVATRDREEIESFGNHLNSRERERERDNTEFPDNGLKIDIQGRE